MTPNPDPTPAGDAAHDEVIAEALFTAGHGDKIPADAVATFCAQLTARGLCIVQAGGTGEMAGLREALEPSDETKAAYSGEFKFEIEDEDSDGFEMWRDVTVPWTTIKEIMKAISTRAALSKLPEPKPEAISEREKALREAAEVARKKWPRGSAHTYASENADRYIALEDASETIADAILNLITATKEKVGE